MRDKFLFYSVCILTPLAILALSKEPKQDKQDGLSPTYNTADIPFASFDPYTSQYDNDTIPTYTNKSLERLQEHVIHQTR